MPTDVTQHIEAEKSVFIGADEILEFTILDANDVAVNITGWTFEFEVRLSRYHPSTIANLVKTTGGGISVPVGSDGKVRVTIAKADSEALKAGTYYYGLARTNAGAWDVKAEGKLVLRKAAVRSA